VVKCGRFHEISERDNGRGGGDGAVREINKASRCRGENFVLSSREQCLRWKGKRAWGRKGRVLIKLELKITEQSATTFRAFTQRNVYVGIKCKVLCNERMVKTRKQLSFLSQVRYICNEVFLALQARRKS